MADLQHNVLYMQEYVQAHKQEMLEDLKTLVEIESPSEDRAGVNRVGAFFTRAFEDLGFQTSKVPGTVYGDHILADRTINGKPRLLLFGHMDTVFPTGTGWPVRIEANRVYGPGVSDMKSGLLGALYALRGLAQMGAMPLSVRVFFNADEEMGSPESSVLLPEIANGVDYACVLEPAEPDGTVITHRNGVGKFVVTVKGRSAHAGQQPKLGIDANLELVYQILAAKELADAARGTTVNAGRIEGGQSPFIISDWAEAQFDIRVGSRAEQERMEAGMKRLEQANHVAGTQISVTGRFHRPPLIQTPGSEKLVEAIQKAAGYCQQRVFFGQGGAASDGNNLSAMGIPVIDGMGPAGGRAHSHDEYLELKDYFDRTTLLAAFMLVLGAEGLH